MKKLFPFKIRPFNMANFSSGSGYLVFTYVFILLGTYILNVIVGIPLTVITAKRAKKNGWVSIRTIKKRLNRIYVPAAIVLTIILSYIYMAHLGFIYSDGPFSMIAYIYCAASPFIIVYLAILTAIRLTDKKRTVPAEIENNETEKTESKIEQGETEVKGTSVFALSFVFVLLYTLFAFFIGIGFMFLIDAFE